MSALVFRSLSHSWRAGSSVSFALSGSICLNFNQAALATFLIFWLVSVPMFLRCSISVSISMFSHFFVACSQAVWKSPRSFSITMGLIVILILSGVLPLSFAAFSDSQCAFARSSWSISSLYSSLNSSARMVILDVAGSWLLAGSPSAFPIYYVRIPRSSKPSSFAIDSCPRSWLLFPSGLFSIDVSCGRISSNTLVFLFILNL